MKYLLDTNVISELRKRTPDPRVAAWISDLSPDDRYLSVVVVGELRRGIERLRPRDARRAGALDDWLGTLLGEYSTRVLPVDLRVAERWGQLTARDPRPTADALLAATAIEYGLTVATRNTTDFSRMTRAVLNPWHDPADA